MHSVSGWLFPRLFSLEEILSLSFFIHFTRNFSRSQKERDLLKFGTPEKFSCISFTADCMHWVASTITGTLIVYETKSGFEIFSQKSHIKKVLQIHSFNKSFVSVGEDNAINRWELDYILSKNCEWSQSFNVSEKIIRKMSIREDIITTQHSKNLPSILFVASRSGKILVK